MEMKGNQGTTSTDVENGIDVSSRKWKALGNVSSYFKEYCNSSGVHGFKYLSDERNGFERLFWAAAIALSIYGCSIMVTKIKTKMETTPVIVTIAENPTNSYHVPFPAVTVCPGSVLRLTAFNYTKYGNLLTKNKMFSNDFLNWMNERNNTFERQYNASEVSDYYTELPWLRNLTSRNSFFRKLWAIRTVTYRNYHEGHIGNVALDEDDMQFLIEVAPKMNKGQNFYLEFGNNIMNWKANYTTLDEHFKHLWTDFGICYTFNMMDDVNIYRDEVVNNEAFKRNGLDKNFPKSSNDWDPDKGYSNILSVETYPWRVPHDRKRSDNALTIMVTENEDDLEGYAGKGSAYYTVMFHQPHDHPIFSLNNYASMPFDKFVDVAVKISVMTTSPGLEKYDPHKRQCYYSHEKHLAYFKSYTRSNCQLECITNISLKACGCVQFYMPRLNTTKICGADSSVCYMNGLAKSDYDEIFATLKYLSASGKLPFNTANIYEECDCLPNCLSITYKADVLATRDMDLSVLKFPNTAPPKPGERLTPAGMWIRMEDSSFTAIQRNEFYGEVDFLANCGGFFGLFCGFSILSFIEIIYFLTIRLGTNIYQRFAFKPRPGLPGGPSDVEDLGRRFSLNRVASIDVSLGNAIFSRPSVCENLPAGSQTERAIRQSIIKRRATLE